MTACFMSYCPFSFWHFKFCLEPHSKTTGGISQLYLTAGNSVFLAWGVRLTNVSSFIRFPNVSYNDGGEYNPSTGIYTCRISGYYWFTASLGKDRGAAEYVDCWILVNESSKIFISYELNNDNNNSFYTVSGSGGFHLTKGDYVRVGHCRYPENISSGYPSHFSGVLINHDT